VTSTGLQADFSVTRSDRFELTLSLSIEAGTTVALLGPNGAGKSTAVAALAGLVPVDTGRIALSGRVLDDPGQGVYVPAEERKVGVVFQDYLLFPQSTVLENVAFGLRSRRYPGIRLTPGRGSGWGGSDWRRLKPAGPETSRAVRPSGWRWPAPSPPTPTCCCWTSRWRRWTSPREPNCATPSPSTSTDSPARAAHHPRSDRSVPAGGPDPHHRRMGLSPRRAPPTTSGCGPAPPTPPTWPDPT
jgi:ABC-type sugar transport system ATPase subunit